MIYRIFAVLTFFAVIAGSLFLSRQQSGAPASTTVQQMGWNEGYSARDARLVETGTDGLPLYTLNAAIIRQQPNEDLVRLTQVRMTFVDENGTPWTATADHGTLRRAAGKVRLTGNVHVFGTPPQAQAPAQITSDVLSVDLHRDLVTTRQPVTMLWAGTVLKSIGLIANLKDYRVQLESQVHGTFSK